MKLKLVLAFEKVEELHDWFHSQLLDRAYEAEDYYVEESRIEKELNEYTLPVKNKYWEGLKAIEKYNPQWFDLACERSQE